MSISACTTDEFRFIISHLRKVVTFPRGYKVTFNLDKCSKCSKCDTEVGHLGLTGKCGKTFKITICSNLSYDLTEYAVMHEMAHVLDWGPVVTSGRDHGPTWGVHFAMIYSAYYGIT